MQQRRRDKDAIGALRDDFKDALRSGHEDEVVALMNERARLERSLGQYGLMARIVKHYRVVHVTSSNIMFGALVLHVVFALMYQVN